MTKAIIIGGGIAGPTTAIALQRAGIEAVVHEAYPGPADDVGSVLTIATNGLDALRAIDLHEVAPAVGFPTASNVLLDHRGRRLGEVSNGGRLPDGTVAHTVERSRLHGVLHQAALDRGIPVRFGQRLVAAEPRSGGGVVARFADGTSTTGDVLIGADGVHSTVRGLIDPAAPAPRYAGLLNFGGHTPGPGPEGAAVGTWYMIFGRRAFFGYVVAPKGGTAWFANLPRHRTTAAERTDTSAASWSRHLLEVFAEDRGPATDLIQRGQLTFAGANTYDLPSVPTWRRGPMVIIGDAAHAPAPSSGQGASMAAEDAVVLAQCLRDHPDVTVALAAFEALRRDRVERVVAHGARTSSSKTPGPVGRALRGLLLPLVFRFLVTDRSMAWLYDHHLEWDRSVRQDDVRSVGASGG
ncbi:FAD-dependent monooxygenase [Nitriliruptor alkaliphilus]|uniref:FAD-dependent monooxygenase n=1 Tax=Nitriliruptor alkaliphilus TaxID=427918 RepID=UPI00069898D6|nr:FAD-dependent monooxygenase [Nitriliruptor alkaliphilus]